MKDKSESFTKILDDIKNRFSSRFIFSFIFFWMIFNWRITISLLWYDIDQIESLGFKNLYEFIDFELKYNSKFFYSIISAISFTFLLPISKSAINIYDSFILEKRNFLKSKILSDSLRKEINSLKLKLSSINNEKIINGVWEIEYNDEIIVKELKDNEFIIPEKLTNETIKIMNGRCFKTIDQKEVNVYSIDNFFYNDEIRELIFIKKHENSQNENDNKIMKTSFVNTLKLSTSSNFDTMTGLENGREITYKRIKIR